MTGISSATPVEPSSHKDAHIGLPGSLARNPRVLDREGQDQTWSLLQYSSTEDGSLWCIHQRTFGPSFDKYTAEDVLRENKPKSQDPPDSRQQSDC